MVTKNKKIGNVPNLRFPGSEGEWERKRLGEVVEFITTNSLSRENLNYENGAVKNIHYGDIHTKFQTLFDITKENVPFINDEVSIGKISEDNYCKEGDIILADASEDLNDVGKSIEVVSLNGEKLLSGLHTLLARPKKNTFHKGFNGYLFKSNNVRTQIQKEAQGTKVSSISAGRISKIEIIYPSISEQAKITAILKLIDERIRTQNKIIKELKSLKAVVSKKIFSRQLRFKEENGNEFSNWKKKKVHELFEITRGNVLSMILVHELQDEINIYPVYSSQTKHNGLAGYFDKYLFEDCITWTTDGAGAGDVNFRKGKFYCTNVCGVLKSNKGFANLFIAELLNTISRKHVSYVGNPKLMNNVMAEISIEIPCLAEQAKTSNFFHSIDEKIETEKKILEYYENQKKYLLANLFI